MPSAEVVGVALRHRQLHFELAQVDHGQQRLAVRHHAAVGDGDRADHAVDRRADGEPLDLALQLGDDRTLALR